MDANQLQGLVQRYIENREFITNEEAAKMGLVVPFIRLLGYDPNLPREVRPEFAADFVQGDGKKLPDRMDYAIFDRTGTKPLMVIETKPLGTDLAAKSQQLARYVAQLPDLHFGIITDGCHYLFYGDLENPNQMDKEPFFSFALDDAKPDWEKVAKFLSKFSRDSFNAGTLVTEAENSRYRQAMINKLAAALKAPHEDDAFMRWLTADIYKGNRTTAVMARLGEVAREAVEPTLLRVMSNEFIDKLREGFRRALDTGEKAAADQPNKDNASNVVEEKPKVVSPAPTRGVVTTPEELEFHRIVQEICSKAGTDPSTILSRDTSFYFNVSHRKPTRWFARFFGDTKRKSVVTWVPVEEATRLAQGFEVEAAPAAFGVSRIYVNGVAQVWAIQSVVVRSLEILQTRNADPTTSGIEA
jgi:predicted type IV restriction endonuclease